MENPGARAVRRVRCPRCHCVLEEPSAPVYQCGGCGTSLRAKNRTGTGSAGDAARASPSRSGLPLPPQSSRHPDASDVASTSRSSSSTPTPPHPHVGSTSSRSGTPTPPTPPDVDGTSWHRAATDATGSADLALVSAGTRVSGDDVASTSSSAPDARRRGTDATTRRGSGGGVVSAARPSRDGSGDGASSTPGDSAASSSRRLGADTTSRGESGGFVTVRNRVSEQVAMIEKREREQSAAGQEVHDDSEGSGPRDAGGAGFSGGDRDATPTPELQDDTEKGMKRQAESTDAARKKHSGEAAAVQPHYNHDRRQELSPKSPAQPEAAQPARDDAGEKAPSPSRHEIQKEHLVPLRKKILKTVDDLKGDLSELFSKSPELNNPPRARPSRLPKQEGYVSRSRAAVTAAASGFPARTRQAAAAAATDGHRGHHGSAARAVKPRQAAAAAAAAPPRGLPSRRYRQCRAQPPCCHNNVEPRPCYHHGPHGCCRHQHHGKPECSSCRGYCCRPSRAHQEPASAPPALAGTEPNNRRRLMPPRNHYCRPVLKGAPFIVCSSCFKLVQVPADFAVSTRTVRRLRCGSCSTVLCYSYRDPARKNNKAYQDSVVDGRCSSSADGGSDELHVHGGGRGDDRPGDPFAFIDGFGLSSYSTEDEQRLPVSRNTSFDTLDGTRGVVGRLHRLMGYGSASDLLLRHSPDLYESFSERTTTPDVRQQYDRKGKGVCIDDDDDGYDVDDSDEEDVGALKRSAGKRSGWPPLPWMSGKGTPAAGAIRIK